MSEPNEMSSFEEKIALYYREEARRIHIPQGLTQRIVEAATLQEAQKPVHRLTFRLFARAALATTATAALLIAAVVIWDAAQQGAASVSAQEILQRVEQTYQAGQPSQDIPVTGVDDVLLLTGTELAEILPRLREHYHAEAVGEETLAGRDHYVLLLVPMAEDTSPQEEDAFPSGAEIRLWVDKKSNLVTQIVVVEAGDVPTAPEGEAPAGGETNHFESGPTR